MPKKLPLISVSDNYTITQFTNTVPQCDYSEGFYTYEVTVTFNQRTHTRASAMVASEKIVQKLLSWLDMPYALRIVMEYQKNNMPHYHIMLVSDNQIDDEIRWDVVKAFERLYGFTTFKPVINYEAFRDYLEKDFIRNYEKYNFPHLIEYLRN